MKTNKILVALALPALFAACTAEEIVNQADNNALQNRALLGDLVANVEGNVDSRASWSETDLTWGAWEEDDVFAAALVDASPGVVGNSLLTNYVYKKNAEGEWTTTSQMVEGIYSFYSYKGIATKNNRDAVKFDLTAQTTDLDNPTQVIDDHQLFFSPLYKIEAKNTTAENNIALPLQFYPYHSIAAFKMVNTTGQTLLISQIIANGQFAAKGSILPAEIAKKNQLYWSVRKGEKTYKVTPKTTNADGSAKTEYTTAEILKAWQESDIDDITTSQSTLAMNCANWVWGDDEEVTAYMVFPAGAKVTSVDINVVDEEGEARLIRVKETATDIEPLVEGKQMSIASTGISKQTFKRSVPVAVFGYTTAGAPKAISVKAENLASATGYYIDTKEALIDLINVSRGDIKVYNFGELVVDAEIAEIITEYTGGNVTFTNPIAIKDTEEVKVSNIKFGTVTVKGADATTDFEGTTVVFENADATTLNIEAGATVTIKGGAYTTINNKGTLTVDAKTMTLGKVVTEGVLNVKGIDRNVELKSGSVAYTAVDLNADNEVDEFDVTLLTINRTSTANASVTIGEKVTWKPAAIDMTEGQAFTAANDVISKKLSITNNGVIEAEKTLRFAELTNNGEIDAEGTVVVYGTATNNGEINAELFAVTFTTGLKSSGSLYNNGYIYGGVRVDKGGYVEVAENSKTTLVAGNGTTTGVARVNNTNLGKVNVPATDNAYTVYYEYTESADLVDWYNLKYDLYNINTIVLNSTFSFDNKDLAIAKITDADTYFAKFSKKVKTLELKNGAAIKVSEGTEAASGFNKVVVDGTVTLSGWSVDQSTLWLCGGSTVELKKNSIMKVVDIKLGAGNNGDGTKKATVNLATETLGENDKVGYILVKDATILEGTNGIVLGTGVVVEDK